jgi:hypothetical protein
VVKGQAIRMLMDADTIYEADDEGRQAQLARATDAREEAAHQLEKNRRRRRQELGEDQVSVRQPATVRRSEPAVEEAEVEYVPAGKSRAHREFGADRDHAFSADYARWETEEQIAALIERAGGKDKLTPEQQAIITRMRQKLEDLIKESGLT